MNEIGCTENIASLMKGIKKFDGQIPGKFREWLERNAVVLSTSPLYIYEVIKQELRPIIVHVLSACPPVAAAPAGADQATIPAHVEAVAAVDEAVVASATATTAKGAAVLKWDRACHDLYATLFLPTTEVAALLVQKHRSGESCARGNRQLAGKEPTTKFRHKLNQTCHAMLDKLMAIKMRPD